MGKETIITAPTMAEALAKVRRELGRDALILNHEETDGNVHITVRSDKNKSIEAPVIKQENVDHSTINQITEDEQQEKLPSWMRPLSPPSKMQDKTSSNSIDEQKSGQINIPTKRSDFKKFINPASSFDETLSAISAVCDLCEFHQLGDALGEAWLRAMNPEFTHTPIQLIPALDRVIPTNPTWLSELTIKKQAVLVGPPGSGKTVTIVKLAAMLLEQGKKVRVITLDTVKAAGAWQLEEYLKPLDLKLYVGSEYLPVARPKEIILIDTPALDINLPRSKEYLKILKEKVTVPYTLVLPADMNPIEAEETAQAYIEANANTVIVTRLELSKRCGVPLRAAYQGLKLVLTSNSPELIKGLQCATPEAMLEKMLAACEISL